MSEQDRVPSAPDRRVTPGAAVARVATAVLLVVGVVALVLGLRGATGAPDTPGAGSPGTVSAGAATAPDQAPRGTPEAGTTGQTPRAGGQGASSAPTGEPTDAPAGAPTGAPTDLRLLPASAPSLLEIPSIGVRSGTFVPLGVQRDGTISVPGTAQEVGLYDGGPTPGQLGSSVVAAHVDTPSGVPGIFHRLREVRAGDLVKVTRRDGSRLVFTVDEVAAYEKSRFPTDRVYKSDFRRAEIRLVTCGGPTDSRNEYRDNVIVFGHLSSAS